MGDNDAQLQIQELRTDLANVKLDVADVKAEVRIVKHDQNNLQQSFNGFAVRVDKFQEGINNKLDTLGDKITATNVRTEKGFSFFAGLAFLFTTGIAAVGLLLKFLER